MPSQDRGVDGGDAARRGPDGRGGPVAGLRARLLSLRPVPARNALWMLAGFALLLTAWLVLGVLRPEDTAVSALPFAAIAMILLAAADLFDRANETAIVVTRLLAFLNVLLALLVLAWAFTA